MVSGQNQQGRRQAVQTGQAARRARRSKQKAGLSLAAVAAATTMLLSAHRAPAATLYWDPDLNGANNNATTGAGLGGAGAWTGVASGTANWWDGVSTTDTSWNNSNTDQAIFLSSSTAAATVTLAGDISVGQLTFKTSGYTITGNNLLMGGAAPQIDLSGANGMSDTITSGLGNLWNGNPGATFKLTTTATAVNSATLNINNASNALYDMTFDIATNAKLVEQTSANQIQGGIGQSSTKTGGGILAIQVANSNTDGWNINGGTIEVTQVLGLGTTAAPITVNGTVSPLGNTALTAFNPNVGELTIQGTNVDAHNIKLQGGILSGDGATTNSGPTYSGTINLASDSYVRLGNFWNGGNSNLSISGSLTGSGNITLMDGGTGATGPGGQVLILSGNNSAYTGHITIDGGHGVQFNSASSFVNLVANNSTPYSGGTVTGLPIIAVGFNTSSVPVITDNTTLGAIFALGNGVNQSTAIDMTTIGSGNWFLGGGVGNGTYSANSLTAGAGGVYRLGGGPGTLTVTNPVVSGSASLVVGTSQSSAAGLLVFSAPMSYSGGTTINGGSVSINQSTTVTGAAIVSGPLGTGAVTLNGGGLAADGSARTVVNNLVVGGNVSLIGGAGGLTLDGSALSTPATVTLAANSTLTVTNNVTINDAISTAGFTLAKAGAGTLVLPGSNTLSGLTVSAGTLALNGANTNATGTTLSGGLLNIGNAAALGAGPLTISGGTIDNTTGAAATLSGNNAQTWGGNFTFAGSKDLNLGSGAVTLSGTRTVTVNAGNLTVGGAVGDGGGNFGILKTGPGTLTLNGVNTYTGPTTITAGKLAVGGSLSSTTLVLGGGNLAFSPGSSGANFSGGTTLNAGFSTIDASGVTGPVALGAITRNAGGFVDFGTLPTGGGSVTTTTANANFAGGQQTILGAYATVGGGTTWAVSGSGATAGTISGLPSGSYASSLTAAADVDAPTGTSTPGAMTINSLRFNTAGGATVTPSGAITVATGGILETANVGNNPVAIGGTSNLTSGNGQDLVVIQNNTASPMTISAPITGTLGVTKAGAGTLVLGGTNTFAGTVAVDGGSLNYSADANLGAAANGVTLNGGTLNYTGTANYTDTRVFTSTGAGGTFNVATAGSGGGKIVFSAANKFTGSGPLTKTGPGWLTMNVGNNNTGGWSVNAGVVEASSQTALGASGTTVTVNGNNGTDANTNGEVGAANGQTVANNIVLNGGIIGGDSASTTANSGAGNTGTFSGSVNVAANSHVRLGDFWGGGSRGLVISGGLSGSGNLSFLNSLSNVATGITNNNGTSQMLTLSGNNSGYTGTLAVDGGHGVAFSNAGAVLAHIAPTNTPSALPIVAMNFDPGLALPAAFNVAGSSTGVVTLNNVSTQGTNVVDMTKVFGGGWYFGASTNGNNGGASFWGSTIIPGNDGNGHPLYRLGGGGGSLFIGNPSIADQGAQSASVVIGDTKVNGNGTVQYATNFTYTGTTTVNAGSTLNLNFNAANPGTVTADLIPTASNLILAGGTLNDTGRANTTNSQTLAGLTVAAGASVVNLSANATANTVALVAGPITRNTGGTVDFTVAANTTATTPTANANFSGGSQTILGGYATFGGTTWAVSGGDGTNPGNISGLSNYSGSFAAGADVDATSATPGTMAVNSIRFNGAAAATIADSGAGDTLTVATGGILETSAVGNNAVAINAANLASGNGQDLIVIQNNTANSMTISSVVSGSNGLTKSGGGNLVLSGANTYSGNTNLNAGTLTVGNALALQNSTVNLSWFKGNLSFGSLANATLGGISGNQNVALGNTAVSVGNNNASTTYGGTMSGGGGLTKIGTGTLTLNNTNSYTGSTTVNGGAMTVATGASLASGSVSVASGGTLNVNGSISQTANVTTGGTVNFAGNTSTSATLTRKLGTLTINPGGTAEVLASASTLQPEILQPSSVSFGDNTSKLDLTNNELLTAGSAAAIAPSVASGQISSSTTTTSTGLGYIDQPGSTVEVRYTLLGDSNLDLKVDVGDLGALATSYGVTGGVLWSNGDFNHDSKVDVGDLGALATNYGSSLAANSGGSSASAASPASMVASDLAVVASGGSAAVPEPGSLTLIGLGAMSLLARRRRRRV